MNSQLGKVNCKIRLPNCFEISFFHAKHPAVTSFSRAVTCHNEPNKVSEADLKAINKEERGIDRGHFHLKLIREVPFLGYQVSA